MRAKLNSMILKSYQYNLGLYQDYYEKVDYWDPLG